MIKRVFFIGLLLILLPILIIIFRFESESSSNIKHEELMSYNLAVLNGSGIPNLGSRTSQKLKEKGINVIETSNADSHHYKKTLLVSYTNNIDYCNYVAEFFNLDKESILYVSCDSSFIHAKLILGRN